MDIYIYIYIPIYISVRVCVCVCMCVCVCVLFIRYCVLFYVLKIFCKVKIKPTTINVSLATTLCKNYPYTIRRLFKHIL